jgi:hypothetical protein
VQQEYQQRAIGLGEIERALQGEPGGGRVAERVPGDRLQQEGLLQTGPPTHSSGGSQDRRERSGRRVRVVLGEAQHAGWSARTAAPPAPASPDRGLWNRSGASTVADGTEPRCQPSRGKWVIRFSRPRVR